MHLLERIIRTVAPHACVGCGVVTDRLVCAGCALSLVPVPSRCYRCKAVSDDYRTCAVCRRQSPLGRVVVFAHHDGAVKELIHRMKYERAEAGLGEAAELIRSGLDYFPTEAVLTHVPTASSRVRLRGYDHALLLTRELAKGSNYGREVFLARTGQAHQVGASRAQRLRQLEGAFRPLKPWALRGAHVVLVDDVVTTGATLETAARTLKRAGAKRVDAIVLAQA